MRIGFDAKRAFLNQTGLGNYSRDTIRILSKYFPSNSYHLYTPKSTSNGRLNFLLEQKNIQTYTPEKWIHKSFSGLWRSVGIKQQLKKDNIELFHGLSHELPFTIDKTNIKTIVTIHDLIFLRYPDFFKKIDRSIYLQKIKYACKIADRIIAVSHQTKDDLINFLKINEQKIDVVYQGCHSIFQGKLNIDELENIKKTLNLPEKYLLYVGSIEERKNLISLLKCLTLIPNKKLVIVGNGKSYKQFCLEFINQHNLNDRILFLSKLSLTEIAGVYQNAEMLIYPSLFEGFGIPILEGLFSEIPVITNKNGCFKEPGGESTIYIDPLNIDEMQSAIEKISNNEGLRNSIIKDGVKHASNFTDDKIAENLMNVYQKVI